MNKQEFRLTDYLINEIELQSVDIFCNSSMAKRLHDMGWDSLYTGLLIPDNFTPPDRCHQFILDGEKTRIDHIPGMGKIRVLLIKLQKKTDHSE